VLRVSLISTYLSMAAMIVTEKSTTF